MGRKISVDSATMMNKALEVIEARWLFGFAPEPIEVVIHPQSVIHSMVVCGDGSVLAQLGTPDMRVPIAYALGLPERIASGSDTLDFLTMGALTFEAPDRTRFPCLQLAYDALRCRTGRVRRAQRSQRGRGGGISGAAIAFLGIARVIQTTLDRAPLQAPRSIDEVLQGDASARRLATTLIERSA